MDRKFLLSLFLALVTVGLFQYFYGRKQHSSGGSKGDLRPGQVVNFPKREQLHKDFNLDVVFKEKKITQKEELIKVETQHTIVEFSNFGAILNTIDYKDHHGKNKKPLRTMYDPKWANEEERKKGNFLLAFEVESPYFYKHLYTKEQDNKKVVAFETTYDDWAVRKIYALHNDSYQIDISLEFEPIKQDIKPLFPRLIFAAPFIHELKENAINAFAYNEDSDSIEKRDMQNVDKVIWFWEYGKNIIVGAEDKYFTHTLIKDESRFVQRAYYKKYSEKNLLTILEGPEITEKQSWTMSFYVGPKLYDHLSFVNGRLSDILSFGWLTWFCKMILKLLEYLYQFFHNFGLAIIVLTIILRLPFVPLSIYSRRKMEDYQKHQPFISRIRTKYKHDLKTQQQEIIRYHQDHNLSPATPMIGCLPMLFQLPILFALYRVLGSYLDLYQAPFYGWIVDLSAKDPYYVLPILMGGTMIWQQSMTVVSDEKQKMIMWFMAIFMTVLFSGFAAGLVLYWLMNNVLAIAEDYLRKKVFS